MPDPTIEPRDRPGVIFPLVAALAMLLAAFPALQVYDPFPGWGTDPTILPAQFIGQGPASQPGPLSIATHLLLVGALALAHRRGGRSALAPLAASGLLLLAGLAAWRWIGPGAGASLDDRAVGSAWLAGLSLGVLAMFAGLDRSGRAWLVALGLGVASVLAVKGLVQVWGEHPQTVADYRATREAFLASQGWSPDSSMARAFERRLMQPEATGWFGLSNVFASFAAWGVVASSGLFGAALLHRRTLGRGVVAGAGLTLALALASLAAAGGKGGFAAAGFGLGLLALGAWARARSSQTQDRGLPRMLRRLGPILGLSAVLLPLLAVLARGLVGERLGELSLLFRWFYVQAAARIFADNPLVGVGPGSFKDAYMLAKPALSPEEVVSPHSVLLDWAACMGLAGLALGVLLVGWCVLAGRGVAGGAEPASPAPGAASGGEDDDATPLRRVVLWWVLGLGVLTAVLVLGERASPSPFNAMARLGGVLAGGVAIGSALAVLRAAPGAAWCLAPAGLALAAHAQIEVTPVTPNAAGLWAALVGAGAAAGLRTLTGPARGRALALVAALALIGAAGAERLAYSPTDRWQHAVLSASARLSEVSGLARRLDALAQGRGTAGEAAALADDLSAALGGPVPAQPRAMAQAVSALMERRLPLAIEDLDRAIVAGPAHFPTHRARGRLLVMHAGAALANGNTRAARDLADRAQRGAEDAAKQFDSASAWAWLGLVRLNRPDPPADDAERLARARAAMDALERAARLDPHGLTHPVQLADGFEALGDEASAALWAGRALKADENLRLDPLRRLSEADRSRLKGLASRAPVGPAGGP